MCIDTIGCVHPLESSLDEEHFQHVVYGINKVLLVLRDGDGLNRRTIVKGGKVLFRMARIIQAYVHKKNKENIPAEEFAKRMVSIVDTAYSIFVGGTIPRVR